MSSDSDDDFLSVSPALKRRLEAVQATVNSRLVSEAQARQARADAAAERAAAAASRRNDKFLARLERKGVTISKPRPALTASAATVARPRSELVLDADSGKFFKKVVTKLGSDGSAQSPNEVMRDRAEKEATYAPNQVQRRRPSKPPSLLSALSARSRSSAPAFLRPGASPSLAHGIPYRSLDAAVFPSAPVLTPAPVPVHVSTHGHGYGHGFTHAHPPAPTPVPALVCAPAPSTALLEFVAADVGQWNRDHWVSGLGSFDPQTRERGAAGVAAFNSSVAASLKGSSFPVLDAWNLRPTVLTATAPFAAVVSALGYTPPSGFFDGESDLDVHDLDPDGSTSDTASAGSTNSKAPQPLRVSCLTVGFGGQSMDFTVLPPLSPTLPPDLDLADVAADIVAPFTAPPDTGSRVDEAYALSRMRGWAQQQLPSVSETVVPACTLLREEEESERGCAQAKVGMTLAADAVGDMTDAAAVAAAADCTDDEDDDDDDDDYDNDGIREGSASSQVSHASTGANASSVHTRSNAGTGIGGSSGGTGAPWLLPQWAPPRLAAPWQALDGEGFNTEAELVSVVHLAPLRFLTPFCPPVPHMSSQGDSEATAQDHSRAPSAAAAREDPSGATPSALAASPAQARPAFPSATDISVSERSATIEALDSSAALVRAAAHVSSHVFPPFAAALETLRGPGSAAARALTRLWSPASVGARGARAAHQAATARLAAAAVSALPLPGTSPASSQVQGRGRGRGQQQQQQQQQQRQRQQRRRSRVRAAAGSSGDEGQGNGSDESGDYDDGDNARKQEQRALRKRAKRLMSLPPLESVALRPTEDSDAETGRPDCLALSLSRHLSSLELVRTLLSAPLALTLRALSTLSHAPSPAPDPAAVARARAVVHRAQQLHSSDRECARVLGALLALLVSSQGRKLVQSCHRSSRRYRYRDTSLRDLPFHEYPEPGAWALAAAAASAAARATWASASRTGAGARDKDLLNGGAGLFRPLVPAVLHSGALRWAIDSGTVGDLVPEGAAAAASRCSSDLCIFRVFSGTTTASTRLDAGWADAVGLHAPNDAWERRAQWLLPVRAIVSAAAVPWAATAAAAEAVEWVSRQLRQLPCQEAGAGTGTGHVCAAAAACARARAWAAGAGIARPAVDAAFPPCRCAHAGAGVRAGQRARQGSSSGNKETEGACAVLAAGTALILLPLALARDSSFIGDGSTPPGDASVWRDGDASLRGGPGVSPARCDGQRQWLQRPRRVFLDPALHSGAGRGKTVGIGGGEAGRGSPITALALPAPRAAKGVLRRLHRLHRQVRAQGQKQNYEWSAVSPSVALCGRKDGSVVVVDARARPFRAHGPAHGRVHGHSQYRDSRLEGAAVGTAVRLGSSVTWLHCFGAAATAGKAARAVGWTASAPGLGSDDTSGSDTDGELSSDQDKDASETGSDCDNHPQRTHTKPKPEPLFPRRCRLGSSTNSRPPIWSAGTDTSGVGAGPYHFAAAATNGVACVGDLRLLSSSANSAGPAASPSRMDDPSPCALWWLPGHRSGLYPLRGATDTRERALFLGGSDGCMRAWSTETGALVSEVLVVQLTGMPPSDTTGTGAGIATDFMPLWRASGLHPAATAAGPFFSQAAAAAAASDACAGPFRPLRVPAATAAEAHAPGSVWARERPVFGHDSSSDSSDSDSSGSDSSDGDDREHHNSRGDNYSSSRRRCRRRGHWGSWPRPYALHAGSISCPLHGVPTPLSSHGPGAEAAAALAAAACAGCRLASAAAALAAAKVEAHRTNESGASFQGRGPVLEGEAGAVVTAIGDTLASAASAAASSAATAAAAAAASETTPAMPDDENRRKGRGRQDKAKGRDRERRDGTPNGRNAYKASHSRQHPHPPRQAEQAPAPLPAQMNLRSLGSRVSYLCAWDPTWEGLFVAHEVQALHWPEQKDRECPWPHKAGGLSAIKFPAGSLW